jgi:hypothetical protein
MVTGRACDLASRTARAAALAALALALAAAAVAAPAHAAKRKRAVAPAHAPAARAPARKPAGRPAANADSTAARPVPAGRSAAPAAAEDSSLTLRGDQEGTVFKSLTVEGEDRIHIEFDRPPLDLDLDPHSAPGLDWGSAQDVLDRTAPDLVAPFLAQSARQPSPYLARPWLGAFASGSVARFHPQVTEVKRWKLTVTTYAGEGAPPREIVWDGRSKSGEPVVPGLTYSYVFEAYDRAGNKRNFVGDAFTVSAFRLQSAEGPILVFSGRELAGGAETAMGPELPSSRAATPAPLLVEAAGWMNQSARFAQPVRVTATARSYEQANALAGAVAKDLAPLLLGDPARVQAVAETEPGAPAEGTVRIAFAR